MHTVPVHGGLLLESCSVQRIEVMTGAKVGQKGGKSPCLPVIYGVPFASKLLLYKSYYYFIIERH